MKRFTSESEVATFFVTEYFATFFDAKKVAKETAAVEKFLRFHPPNEMGKRKHSSSRTYRKKCGTRSDCSFPLISCGGESRRNFSRAAGLESDQYNAPKAHNK